MYTGTATFTHVRTYTCTPLCSGYPVYPYELLQASQPEETPNTVTKESVDISSNDHPTTTNHIKPEPDDKYKVVTFNEIENSKKDVPLQGCVHFKDEQSRSASTTSLDTPTPSSKRLKERTERAKSLCQVASLSGPETRSLLLPKVLEAEDFKKSKEEEFLASLVTPQHTPTQNARAIMKDLFLPPPPPPDISHVLSSSEQKLPRSSSTLPTLHVSPRTSLDVMGIQKVSPSQSRKKMRKSNEKLDKLLQPKREKFCQTGLYDIRLLVHACTCIRFGS